MRHDTNILVLFQKKEEIISIFPKTLKEYPRNQNIECCRFAILGISNIQKSGMSVKWIIKL